VDNLVICRTALWENCKTLYIVTRLHIYYIKYLWLGHNSLYGRDGYLVGGVVLLLLAPFYAQGVFHFYACIHMYTHTQASIWMCLPTEMLSGELSLRKNYGQAKA